MREHTSHGEYRPASVSPPGHTIADLLEERDLRQAELATRMGVSAKFISELVTGKASMTPTTALALERSLDVPAEFWLAREASYQAAQARINAYSDLQAHTSWLSELPLKDMIKYEWVPNKPDKAAMVEACLHYFGVASVPAWRQQYVVQTNASAAYRASEKFERDPGAVAAWLRRGEIEAAQVECKPFDREAFMAALTEARKLTLVTDPAKFLPRLMEILADCGVALVIVRAPTGCPVNGAVRWVSPQKVVIQLTVRGLSGDVFWFSFFHECGHIALHGKKILFLEGKGMSGAEEVEADRFASERLIPMNTWQTFTPESITDQAINEFAQFVGIHPGIVVGRLQTEKRLPWNRGNSLKARYTWKED
jgi:HTH-type transcriptional regulator / antitoxin HigA